jgi:hypothetical protein
VDYFHLTLEGLIVLAALGVVSALLATLGVSLRPELRRPTCRRCGADLRVLARALPASGSPSKQSRCPRCEGPLVGRRVRWRSTSPRLRPLLLGLLLLVVAGTIRFHGWSLESRGVGWSIYTAPWVVERIRHDGERGNTTISEQDWAVLSQALHAGALDDDELRVVAAQVEASKAAVDWRAAPLPVRQGVAYFLGEACAQCADATVRASIARAAGAAPMLSISEVRNGTQGLEVEFVVAEAETRPEAPLGGFVRVLAVLRSVEVDGRRCVPRRGAIRRAQSALMLFGLPTPEGPMALGEREAWSMVVELDAAGPDDASAVSRGIATRTLTVELDMLVLDAGLGRRIDDGWPAATADWATVGPVQRQRLVATFVAPAASTSAAPRPEPAR